MTSTEGSGASSFNSVVAVALATIRNMKHGRQWVYHSVLRQRGEKTVSFLHLDSLLVFVESEHVGVPLLDMATVLLLTQDSCVEDHAGPDVRWAASRQSGWPEAVVIEYCLIKYFGKPADLHESLVALKPRFPHCGLDDGVSSCDILHALRNHIA